MIQLACKDSAKSNSLPSPQSPISIVQRLKLCTTKDDLVDNYLVHTYYLWESFGSMFYHSGDLD